MNAALEKRITTDLHKQIESLDLSMIKLKLQDEDEGQGWTDSKCDEVEKEYKRFLILKRLYPNKEIVPHREIDLFWHQHILDTEKYAEDCERCFGHFLHHYPYFGMNGPEDAQNLANAFEETKELYKDNFNEDYIGDSMRCKAPKCRTQCKPMKCR
jgi:hypothetical protein